MCWYTCKKEHLQKKTAESDIKVIKILMRGANGKFYSPYHSMRYPIGKVRHSVIDNPVCYEHYNAWNIRNGLHSYSTEIKFVVDVHYRLCIMPKEGSERNRLDYWYWYPEAEAVIFEAVIPKGSEYYENEGGEYVSSQLKVVNIIAEIDNKLLIYEDKICALNEKIRNL